MSANSEVPLVVDLDGTLTPTDTLVESALQAIRHSPLNLVRLPLWLLQGKVAFKAKVAAQARIAAELLPYCEPLITYLTQEKARGREIVLATAAHRSVAEPVARHLGLFSRVIATDDGHNLKGSNKLQAIREQVGEKFVYAGDCAADLPIWQASSAAILVGVPAGLARKVKAAVPIEQEFASQQGGLRIWLKAMRIYQWAKNLLLFVPLLTAFSFTNLQNIATMTLAFLAFSLTASATYMANDLWDLENDRAHPRKHKRPFASARLTILPGMGMVIFLLLAGFTLAYTVSVPFCLMLAGYLLLTTSYSLVLKNRTVIDVLMLAVLYTLRILAGSVAIAVPTSSWLLSMSAFTFLSLALVKRCTELLALQNQGHAKIKGRNYHVEDLVVLCPLGVSSAFAAIVMFGLFISAPETRARYATPDLLWLVAIVLIYWLARLWIKTARGLMHDDPLIYAVRDLGSRLTVLSIIVLVLIAHFLKLQLPL